MQEQDILMRLVSVESNDSTLSSDSCEYYQTDIFDQLPSVQASRPEQSRWAASEPPPALPDRGCLSRGARDKTSTQPLRNLPLCIQAKRDTRERRNMQISNIGVWESWRRSQSISRKRVWAHMGGAISYLLPWKRTLHVVEGRFGVGVKAYFVFLRYLVFLNLLHCALICGFILGPTFYGRGSNSNSSSDEALRFGGNDSVLNFFLGTGYLSRSPVFFGFYTHIIPYMACWNTPLVYLAGIIIGLFLSLIMVVRRTTVGYKHTWILGRRYETNMSYKIFCGWDFTIQDPDGATLKSSFVRNDLRLFLEEQSFSLYKAQRTLGVWVRLYLLRFVLNLFILCLLGGAFYLIYFVTVSEHLAETNRYHWLLNLLLHYLPPFTITFVNLFLPLVFRKISSFEDYSFTVQVNATLVRSIFLKLTSLGMYLFFALTNTKTNDAKTNQPECAENQFGSEIYKLYIFHFLTTLCNAFLLNYPRKLLQEKYPSSLLARLSGKQRFLIPLNVLDLVYSQTVCWVGIYFCPLLPLIGIVILVLTFYIKKFTVLRCCVAEQRMLRASTSSVLFYFMLLLGLLMAATTLGFSLFKQIPMMSSFSPCGPFANGETVFNVTRVCVDSLPALARTSLHYLSSEAFALPLILVEIIILTSYVSRGRTNQKAIDRLKDMLVMCSSDKRFLVKQHATMHRRKNASAESVLQAPRRTAASAERCPPRASTDEGRRADSQTHREQSVH